MPAEQPLDPTLLKAVAGELDRSGTAALAASDELLAHYGDTGDDRTQRAVDTLIDNAVEALRAVSDSMADSSRELERRV
jgi:hypothetical protein